MRPLPALTFAIALCAAATMARAAEPQTDEEKALYALGVAMSTNITSFNLSDAELEFVKAGIADGAKGKTPKFDPQQYFPKLQEMQKTRAAAAGKAVLDKAAAEKGAKRTAVGPRHHDAQGRHGRRAEGDRHRQGALSRHAAERQSVRQLASSAASRLRSRSTA